MPESTATHVAELEAALKELAERPPPIEPIDVKDEKLLDIVARTKWDE